MTRTLLALLLALLAAQAQAQPAQRFSFAIIGDAPYSKLEEIAFARQLEELDQQELAFVVHIGDFKSGASPCTDALFAQRLQQFQSVRHPFIFVPGDNEWTDCHRRGADPLERLGKLRQMFYPDEYSLGRRKLKLARQSDDPRFAEYRENVRWRIGAATFIGLNIPGSNNNLGRTPQMDAEYARRSAANTAWLAQGFELAKQSGDVAVFIAIQADPDFDGSVWRWPGAPDGYAPLRRELLAHTLAFGKAVVLIHGDMHRYTVDHPLRDPASGRPIKRFTRIESFGSPLVDWIKVDVDTAAPDLLTIRTGTEIKAAR